MALATRLTSTGTLFTNKKPIDEVTGMIIIDPSMQLNLDATVNAPKTNSVYNWYDTSGSGNNFTITTATLTKSVTSYYTIAGPLTNPQIQASSNFADQLSNMTVAGWVRTSYTFTGSPAYYPPIVCKMRDQGSTAGWVFGMYWDGSTDRLSFYIQTDGNNAYGLHATTTTTNDGQWHYVAATLSGGAGGTIKLYQDGVLITNPSSSFINAGTVTSWSTTTNVTVGSDVQNGYGSWPGDIAEVEIYNRVLSDAEIQTNFSAHAARYGKTPTSTIPANRISTTTVYSSSFDEVTLALGSLQCNATGGSDAFINTPTPTPGKFSFPGAFTVEFFALWLNRRTGSNEHFIGVLNTGGFVIAHAANGSLGPGIYPVSSNANLLYNTNFSAAWAANTWYHMAATRDNSNFVRFFVNGILQGAGATYAGTFTSGVFSAGSDYNGGTGNGSNLYLSNLRVVDGYAVYTSNFSYPTKVLSPSYTGTQLALNMYSNATWSRDASPNYYVMTTTGVVTWLATGAFNKGNFTLRQRLLNDGTLQNYFINTTATIA